MKKNNSVLWLRVAVCCPGIIVKWKQDALWEQTTQYFWWSFAGGTPTQQPQEFLQTAPVKALAGLPWIPCPILPISATSFAILNPTSSWSNMSMQRWWSEEYKGFMYCWASDCISDELVLKAKCAYIQIAAAQHSLAFAFCASLYTTPYIPYHIWYGTVYSTSHIQHLIYHTIYTNHIYCIKYTTPHIPQHIYHITCTTPYISHYIQHIDHITYTTP